MLTLYLVRHAKAMAIAPSDKDRELDPQGQEDAAAIGALFSTSTSHDFVQPELVLCSSALRTLQTYEVMVKQGLAASDFAIDEGLYNASASYLLDEVTNATQRSVMVIGHNPALAIMLNWFVADDVKPELMHFPTATIAHLSFDLPSFADLSQTSSAKLHALLRGSQLALQ